MRSIKGRIERALTLVAIVPVVLLSAYAYLTAENILETSGQQNTHSQMSLMANRFQDTLKPVKGDLYYLRDSNSLFEYGRALVINDEKQLELQGRYIARDFLSIVNNRKLYNQIALIDAKGNERIRVEHNEQEGSSRIVQPELLANRNTSPHFQATKRLAFNETYTSEMDLTREQGVLEEPIRPTVRFATPLFAVGERFVGVLMISVDANALLAIVNERNSQGDTQFTLLSPSGFYLAGADTDQLWGSVHDLGHGANYFSEHEERKTWVQSNNELASELTDESILTRARVYADHEHQALLGYLLADTPNTTAYALLFQYRYAFLAFIVIAAIAAFFYARYLAKTMTAPLRALTKAADELSHGEVDTPIEIKTNDEIQTLAESFERLRESLKLMMKL
jgi:HAMP domain-containing protein